MRAKLLPALLIMLILSSCGSYALPLGGVNDLLEAPILNKMQSDISKALERTVNLSTIIFRYPQTGENYRSPFIFADMDNDGSDEAVVFYSYTSAPSEIRTKILRLDGENNWIQLCDIAGQGDQVEFVEFKNIVYEDRPCVIIGWLGSARRDRTLEIYAMNQGKFDRLLSQSYIAMVPVGSSGEFSKIAMITQEQRRDPFELKLLVNGGGEIVALSTVRLYQDVSSILQMKQGLLWDGGSALFIDEILDNDTVATEIIRLGDGGFELVAGSGNGTDSAEMKYYIDTYRPNAGLCTDISGSGVYTIPKQSNLPAEDESDEVTPIYLTTFWKPGPDGLVESASAVIDEASDYMVFFPEKWLGRVTVVDNPEANKRSFHEVDPVTLMPAAELLRVTIYSMRDYSGDYPKDYFELGVRGVQVYMGYIPKAEAPEDLSIDEKEAASMFRLT